VNATYSIKSHMKDRLLITGMAQLTRPTIK